MTSHLAAQLLAGLALALVNIGALFQAAAVIRRRPAVGVSLVASGSIVVSCAAWVVYSSVQGLALSTASSACGLVIWSVVTLALVRQRSDVRELRTPAFFALALVLAAAVAGTVGLGSVLVAEVVLTSVPQLWRVHRFGATGVSTVTWATIATAATCWLVYGIAFADLSLTLSQGVRAAGAAWVTGAVVSARAGRS